MAKVYFHYSNSEGVCVDQRGTAVGNLTDFTGHFNSVDSNTIDILGDFGKACREEFQSLHTQRF